MLLTRRGNIANALDSVHNYYEHLVVEQIHNVLTETSDLDYLADVACVALNQLPPRYIRHDVDMAFYLPSNERHDIHAQVIKAVTDAIKFVDDSKQRYDNA
jgi:Late competence development protein ComFB